MLEIFLVLATPDNDSIAKEHMVFDHFSFSLLGGISTRTDLGSEGT